jgi:hypothetical protein
VFDYGQMNQDCPGPDRDRLIVAELSGAAQRHARWGGLTDDEKAAGAAELREIAGDSADLLAQEAGLALGTNEGKRAEFEGRGQAIAELCRQEGADEVLIPQWIEEGRRRGAARRMPPFSKPARVLRAARKRVCSACTSRSSRPRPAEACPLLPSPNGPCCMPGDGWPRWGTTPARTAPRRRRAGNDRNEPQPSAIVRKRWLVTLDSRQ